MNCRERPIMPPRGPVADYLAALGRELAFDPALARRVCNEVEDHLVEAVTCDPPEAAEPGSMAERRAIDRFGDPRDIAAAYRAASLSLRTRSTAGFMMLALAGIFLAMKARVAWYGMVHWEAGDDLKALAGLVLPFDRYAFLLATGLGLAAWLYASGCPVSAGNGTLPHIRLRRCHFLSAAAALSAAVAVGVEGLLTAVRLTQVPFSAIGLLPAGSMIAEIVLTGLSAFHIRNTMRRMAHCSPRR
jgi:hypothetical protein